MKAKVFFSFMFLSVSMFVCVSHTAAEYERHTQFSLPEGAKARLGKGSLTGNIAYSPDGTRLAVASSIGIWIYDAQTGEELDLFTGNTGPVYSVAFSPDGQTLASGSDDENDKTMRLWDVATGHTIREYEWYTGVYSVAFSPDGQMLAGGSGAGTVLLWGDVEMGNHRTPIKHTSGVNSVSFSPDGKTIASGSRDDTIRLWNVQTGTEMQKLTGHTDDVTSVSFSPDGNTLASGSSDNTIRLWDVADGEEIHKLTGHTSGVNSVSFSPDGKTLASGSSNKILVWDANTREMIRTFTGHTDRVRSVVFSPDGKTLASGSQDNTILLWGITPASPEQEKNIIVQFRLKNGKQVTLYDDPENEDKVVYAFGMPGEKPELEYSGTILAKVSAKFTLWGEGVGNLADLAAVFKRPASDSHWRTWGDEDRDTTAQTIAKAADANESHGFIYASLMTGIIDQSVYIFRAGGWEYIIEGTWGRPVTSDNADYESYSLTVISPKGKIHHFGVEQKENEQGP